MGSFIALIIALSPLLFYSYKLGVFPNGKVWKTPFFTLTSQYYESLSTFSWVLLGKLTPLYLLCIWFFTCRYWWYWAIIIPIGMYIFQIVSLFNDEFNLKDEPVELIYIFPYMLIVGVGLYFIRKKILKYIEMFNLKEQIESEVKKVELELER
ncbi:hypothetical protein ABMY20_12850 [Tenacibaculum sp. SSH1-16]|uniref:hypothetical protein n=1 Tax=Tenacibaculum sp. SSH1-16 TaxID=3136667 RepID=UPI0032C43826